MHGCAGGFQIASQWAVGWCHNGDFKFAGGMRLCINSFMRELRPHSPGGARSIRAVYASRPAVEDAAAVNSVIGFHRDGAPRPSLNANAISPGGKARMSRKQDHARTQSGRLAEWGKPPCIERDSKPESSASSSCKSAATSGSGGPCPRTLQMAVRSVILDLVERARLPHRPNLCPHRSPLPATCRLVSCSAATTCPERSCVAGGSLIRSLRSPVRIRRWRGLQADRITASRDARRTAPWSCDKSPSGSTRASPRNSSCPRRTARRASSR